MVCSARCVDGECTVVGFTNTRINHIQSQWISGAATTMTLVPSDYGIVGAFNGPGAPALGDSFRTESFQIVPGTYNMHVIELRKNNRGLVTWYLDKSTVSFGSSDLYATPSDVVLDLIPITIPASFNNSHYLRGVVSKNAASNGYMIDIGEIWFD